jgi:signal transduction histidine kinase
MLREEGQPERTTRGLRRVATSAERMGRMIVELLDYTRGRLGGGIALHRQSADARDVSLGVLEALGEARPGREVRFHAEGELRGAWDVDRLGQLVGHLATHALDASPEELPVTVALRGEEDAVCLEVSHGGPPLSEELLAGLFEPFHRGTRKSRGVPPSGLGLGLYIAQEIARAHGGTLEARSTAEEGTRFTVRLPRHAPGPPD